MSFKIFGIEVTISTGLVLLFIGLILGVIAILAKLICIYF